MLNRITGLFDEWLPLLLALILALTINALFVLVPSFSKRDAVNDPIEPQSVEISLNEPYRVCTEYSDAPLLEPEPLARPFVVQNNLPTEMLADMQPDENPKRLNGFWDSDDGGTASLAEAKRSGGGGGSGVDAVAIGHAATDDRVWARMKWKPDPKAPVSNEAVAGDANGKGTSVPGTLKTAGAGDGLGNGKGSGALASQGTGSGSGAGANGANSGQGLGKAAPIGVSRKPGVVSMNRGVYPASARAARHEGTVTLSVEVLPTGDVGKVEVKTSSGFEELDQAALSAAKEWRFTGALTDGAPVAFWYSIPYRFVLTEQ